MQCYDCDNLELLPEESREDSRSCVYCGAVLKYPIRRKDARSNTVGAITECEATTIENNYVLENNPHLSIEETNLLKLEVTIANALIQYYGGEHPAIEMGRCGWCGDINGTGQTCLEIKGMACNPHNQWMYENSGER